MFLQRPRGTGYVSSGYRQNRHRGQIQQQPLSQSLQDQGTVRIHWSAEVRIDSSLNPFKIRVPSEYELPHEGGHDPVSIPSRSGYRQNVLLRLPVQET